NTFEILNFIKSHIRLSISLKEALVCAQSEHRLTVGVYESAKIMTEDPDNVSFCVLATDEQFEWDVALQIHFTLIQSFCFDNDISIVRVSDTQRLAAIVGDEQEDAHCVFTVSASYANLPYKHVNISCCHYQTCVDTDRLLRQQLLMPIPGSKAAHNEPDH
uniref:Ribosomal protein eL8/eL30/eS12/Gadd45 domain-containing protein n=1 Tax=Xiphophorus couchianus TaxID=32473 RepID=A0A3B5LDZ5_9TELE